MPITRDANYSPEAAQLFALFNSCSNNHSLDAVMEAAGNMAMSVIVAKAKDIGVPDDQFERFAQAAASGIVRGAVANWNRKPLDSDIEVKAS